MHISYHDPESRMQRPIRPTGQFLVYLTAASLTPEVILSGEEVTRIVATHCATAHLLVQTAAKLASTLPPARRLLSQHKPLRMSHLAPHAQEPQR